MFSQQTTIQIVNYVQEHDQDRIEVNVEDEGTMDIPIAGREDTVSGVILEDTATGTVTFRNMCAASTSIESCKEAINVPICGNQAKLPLLASQSRDQTLQSRIIKPSHSHRHAP